MRRAARSVSTDASRERLKRDRAHADRPTPSMYLLKHVECLNLGRLGYGMVAVALVIWPGAAIAWKKRIQPKERT